MPDDEKPPKKIGGANTHKYSGPEHGRGQPQPHEIEMHKLRERLANESVSRLRDRIEVEIEKEKQRMSEPPNTPEPERNIVFDQYTGMWVLIHPTDGPVFQNTMYNITHDAAYEYGLEPDPPSPADLHYYEEHLAQARSQVASNEQMMLYINRLTSDSAASIDVELRPAAGGNWELRAYGQEGGVLFGTPDEALAYTTGMGFTIKARIPEAVDALQEATRRMRGDDPPLGVEPPEPTPDEPAPAAREHVERQWRDRDHEPEHDPLPDYVVDAMGPSPEPGPHPVDEPGLEPDQVDGFTTQADVTLDRSPEPPAPDVGEPDMRFDAPTPPPDFDPRPQMTYSDQLHAAAESSPDPTLTHTTATVVSQMPGRTAVNRQSTATPTGELRPTPPNLRPQPSNGIKLTRR